MTANSGKKILIKGEGIAALSVAQILSKNGISVSIQQERNFKRPFLLLPEITRWLLTDIWGNIDHFFPIDAFINGKKVYEQDGRESEFSHVGYPISQDTLQIGLKNCLKENHPSIKWLSPDEIEDESNYVWTINAIAQDSTSYKTFGNRFITSYEIDMNQSSEMGHVCRMFVTEKLWIFLFPFTKTLASLQIMHLQNDLILFEEIHALIKGKSDISIVRSNQKSPDAFDASPRILKPVGWYKELYIGQSLVKYDPIAGDGTGLALRSADWACKIVLAAFMGKDISSMLDYYYNSVKSHFEEHLNTCNEHYQKYQDPGWSNKVFLENVN